MCAPIGNSVMAFACVVGTACRDAADLLFRRDLIEEVGQHRCITDMAPGDLDSVDLQCFLINSEMDLAPDTPLRTAMFAGVPFAFSLDLDPGAIDHQVQRALGATVGDVNGQGFLTARQRAEVGHRPVEANQAQQAFDEPCCLP